MNDIRPITAIILNAGSGDGAAESARDTLQSVFAEAGHVVTVTLVRSVEELRIAVQDGLRDNAHTIVAGGGDGTVNGVAQLIIGQSTLLGVLPLGTLNHFARDLGIPLDLREAAQVILNGTTMRVDVGEVNGRYFLNNSSLGMYPRIVQLRERYKARGVLKWFVAAWATLRVMSASRPIRLRIQVDGRDVERTTPLVFIGNNEYRMAGFDAGSRESLVDGQLAIYVVKTNGRWRLLRLVWRILTGTAQRSGELALVRATVATIDTSRTLLPVAVDGEVESLRVPLHYRIHPRALNVHVPSVTR